MVDASLSKSVVLGTLVGGAVGDAMGAPFEGLWSESIPSSESLLAGYHEYHGYPRGQYTDDTQLTLATIESIVEFRTVQISDIARRIAELWRHQSVIGPGGACTQAAERYLATGDYHGMGAPDGQAGNGTAMRTAALGIWFDDHSQLVQLVGDISRLTHTDSRSVAGGVAIAGAANLLASSDEFTMEEFCETIADTCSNICPEISRHIVELPKRIDQTNVLEFIANAGQANPEFNRPIITPFVIPTVLASLYCVMKYPESWTAAVTGAIRLGGDVDTLGAIVGALAGARHGFASIPEHLVDSLVDSHRIQVLAAQYHARIAAR